MINKLMIYCWESEFDSQLIKAVNENNIKYITFSEKITNYHADSVFATKLIEVIHKEKVEAILSYDYFPLISSVCEINKIPYLSWIFDCPQYTLYSKTITNKMNYIYCFDAVFAERIYTLGASNVFHVPLATDTDKYLEILNNESKKNEVKRKYDNIVSFIGNFYNGEKNRLRSSVFSDYITGYLDGVIEAQLLTYGYNFIRELLDDTVVQEVLKQCEITLGKEYIWNPEQMAADAVGMEVSARERELVIESLSNRFPVTLFSTSILKKEWNLKPLLNIKGHADYEKEAPYIFYNSKINLNITSCTIESGIPQRVLDILGCGGFCLTNYQPEIAEYFVDGEELVMYSSLDDLFKKVEYYLQHEEERKGIAQKGYLKVKKEFSLKERVANMINSIS